MALKCTSCGGTMVFNIGKQNLLCEYCGQEVPLSEYHANNDAEVSQADGLSAGADGLVLDVYQCRNCGAKLCAPAEQTVAYCSYCGNESLMQQKEKEEYIPKKIIPFCLTKKRAEEQYTEALRGKLFVPKEMRDPAFIEGFRGIYIPYMTSTLKVERQDIAVKARKAYTKGGYDYLEEYDVEATIGGQMDGGTHDASAAFDDTIANEIAPYRAYGLKPFHQGYLAGFYADKITSDEDVYREITLADAPDEVKKKLVWKSHGATPTSNAWQKETKVSIVEEKISLFPIWFLTWKKKKRVAYSVMNGQTGKMMMDVPVDMKAFMLRVLLFSLIPFVILSLLDIYINPLTLAGFCSVFLYVASYILRREIKVIGSRESHEYDAGFGTDPKKIIKRFGKRKSMSIGGCLMGIVYVIIWGFIILDMFAMLASTTPNDAENCIGFIAVFQVAESALCIIACLKVRNKIGVFMAIANVVLQFASLLMAGDGHPHDYWYYGIAIICLGGMILNCLVMMFYMNYLTTRPVPNFFTREGANNKREK